MDFGTALHSVKGGAKIARSGWNGKGLWVQLQKPDLLGRMTLPYLYLSYPATEKKPFGDRVPWVPSQTDILAEDWHTIG